ncbi:MAG: hydrogenase maturation nickel metallochaperone HypA [Candidatus Omnitrophica bacterium]|nr:hydrogenase maturation nickel metallochaperone HypA [Candidatus Omnitrophota bacterium]
MHETHLIEPVIRGICEHAKREGAKSVSKIRLKVGEFTGSKETSFRETFRVLAKGTLLENAQLELTFYPGSIVQVLSFDID